MDEYSYKLDNFLFPLISKIVKPNILEFVLYNNINFIFLDIILVKLFNKRKIFIKIKKIEFKKKNFLLVSFSGKNRYS